MRSIAAAADEGLEAGGGAGRESAGFVSLSNEEGRATVRQAAACPLLQSWAALTRCCSVTLEVARTHSCPGRGAGCFLYSPALQGLCTSNP